MAKLAAGRGQGLRLHRRGTLDDGGRGGGEIGIVHMCIHSPFASAYPLLRPAQAALAYKLAPDTWFTGKVNHLGHVGLSYAQQVGQGQGGVGWGGEVECDWVLGATNVVGGAPGSVSDITGCTLAISIINPPCAQVSPLAKLTFATEVHAASPTADVQSSASRSTSRPKARRARGTPHPRA